MVMGTGYRSNPNIMTILGIGVLLLTLALWLSLIFI
ncbi:hypothetical protein CD178_02784 [Komagataeibacter saccharivorans]|uniref:Uncharacterized protein n=1 Tax=Komagataeibacter saccharivorans TaxID=265959 RepID=A0A347WF87_9PROT|nr:hypothetical protein CD178_02784 [Komagataeibacter saccharivorans]QBL92573.1 hypothetical protein KSAC_03260 [Komagataeibacter saccharivorans]